MKHKIAYQYRTIIFALLMSLCTALIVSGSIIYIHFNHKDHFLHRWFEAFITAWPIVFVAILVIAPMVNRALNYLIEDKQQI